MRRLFFVLTLLSAFLSPVGVSASEADRAYDAEWSDSPVHGDPPLPANAFTDTDYPPPPDCGPSEGWTRCSLTGYDPAADHMIGHVKAGWTYETVDGGDDLCGFTPSLELDSDGYPHIAHTECRDSYESQGYLVYLRWTGSEWVEELRYWGAEGAGPYADPELDENGLPHIAYGLQCEDLQNGHLGYSYFDGEEWHHEVVDDGPVRGFTISLGLDSQEHPHIAYGEYYGGLWYAYHDGEGWSLQHLDDDPRIQVPCCSLELDRFDHPHISYSYQTNEGHLRYVHWDGSDWIYEEIGPTQFTRDTSLELDSLDRPHISFCGLRTCSYAYYNGSEWEYEVVDDFGPTGYSTCLVLDSNDTPWISYCNAGYTLQDLRLAHRTAQGWETEVLDDSSEFMGKWSSLKLDSDGHPRIAYMDYANADLRYAWYEGVQEGVLTAETCNDGVLLSWNTTGVAPASLCLLRSVGDGEPTVVSGALPGSAVRWLDMEVDADVEYSYWLEVTDAYGLRSRFGPTEPVALPGPVHELAFSVRPSPASASVTFECTLPEEGRVTIALYDLSGRRVGTPVDAELTAGRHELAWDATSVPSGVYLAHLDTGTGSLTERLVVAR